MCRRVALRTVDLRVLSLQHIARLRVVKSFLRRNPVNQLEIFAVMFGVALRTRLPVRKCRVKPVPAAQFARNFLVAARAVEHCRSLPNHMARGALRRAIERLVRVGKGTGRNLCT